MYDYHIAAAIKPLAYVFVPLCTISHWLMCLCLCVLLYLSAAHVNVNTYRVRVRGYKNIDSDRV